MDPEGTPAKPIPVPETYNHNFILIVKACAFYYIGKSLGSMAYDMGPGLFLCHCFQTGSILTVTTAYL